MVFEVSRYVLTEITYVKIYINQRSFYSNLGNLCKYLGKMAQFSFLNHKTVTLLRSYIFHASIYVLAYNASSQESLAKIGKKSFKIV